MMGQWMKSNNKEASPKPQTLAARSMARKLVQLHLSNHKKGVKSSRQKRHHPNMENKKSLQNTNLTRRRNKAPLTASETSDYSVSSSSSECSSCLELTEDEIQSIGFSQVEIPAYRSSSCFFIPPCEDEFYSEYEGDDLYFEEDSTSEESDDSDCSIDDDRFFEDSNGYIRPVRGKHSNRVLKKGFLLKKKAIKQQREITALFDDGYDTAVSTLDDTEKKANFATVLTGAFKNISGAMFNCSIDKDAFQEETAQREIIFESFDNGFLLQSKDRKDCKISSSSRKSRMQVSRSRDLVLSESAAIDEGLVGTMTRTPTDSVSTMVDTLWKSIPKSAQLREGKLLKKTLPSSIYGSLFGKTPSTETKYSYGKDYRFTVDISGTEEVVFYANGKFHSVVEEQLSLQDILLSTKFETAYFRFLIYAYTILERVAADTKFAMERQVVSYKRRDIAGYYDLARDKVLIHLLANIIYAYSVVQERIKHLQLITTRRTGCRKLTIDARGEWQSSHLIRTFTLSYLGKREFWRNILFLIISDMMQRREKCERDFIQQRQIVPFDRKSDMVRPEDISWARRITNLVINIGLAFTMIESSPKCTKRYSAWQGHEYLIWDEDVYDFARPWAMSQQVRNKHICQRLRACLSSEGFQMPKSLKVDVTTVPIVYDEMDLCPPAPPTPSKPKDSTNTSRSLPAKKIVDPIILFTKAVYLKEWDKSTYINETAPCVTRVEKDKSQLSLLQDGSLWANTRSSPTSHSSDSIWRGQIGFPNNIKYKTKAASSLLAKAKMGIRAGNVAHFWAPKYGKRRSTN